MGRGDAGIGQAADRRGDAGHDAERDARAGQRQRLLAAAAEDEGIAALEAQHALPGARQADESLGNVRLLRRRLAAALPGIVERRARPRQLQNARVDQRIVDDGVGVLQRVQRQQRQQPRIARPRPHQPHRPRREIRQVERERDGIARHDAAQPTRRLRMRHAAGRGRVLQVSPCRRRPEAPPPVGFAARMAVFRAPAPLPGRLVSRETYRCATRVDQEWTTSAPCDGPWPHQENPCGHHHRSL